MRPKRKNKEEVSGAWRVSRSVLKEMKDARSGSGSEALGFDVPRKQEILEVGCAVIRYNQPVDCDIVVVWIFEVLKQWLGMSVVDKSSWYSLPVAILENEAEIPGAKM